LTGSPERILEALDGWLPRSAGPFIMGLCGSQGSGKSTLAALLTEHLEGKGRRVATLSLDDLYLSRTHREELGRRVHPLFAVRGPPGTHDVELGADLLDALKSGNPVRLPRFDKAEDAPALAETWPAVTGPVDVVIFEGWCVGAAPEPAGALAAPVNALEAQDDPDGVWRRAVNDALAGPYAELFSRMDRLVMLAAPSFDVVRVWRTQQEHDLKRRLAAEGRTGAHVMSDADIARFIQHYERLTRHMLRDMPGRADLVLHLDENRRLKDVP
jgi:D-glycerate 3-kinase